MFMREFLYPLGCVKLIECTVLWHAGRAGKGGDFGQIWLPENETTKLMMDHVPASLHFSNLGTRPILPGYWLSGSGRCTP